MNKNKVVLLKLQIIDANMAKKMLLLHQLKKDRHTNIVNMRFQLITQMSLSVALQGNMTFGKYRRQSVFWEIDVPNMTDNIFKETFRMSRNSFSVLCHLLAPMEKEDNNLQKSIALPKRIAIALSTLKSSAEYLIIAQLFGVGKATVCVILKEFCEEVWRGMSSKYMSPNFLSIEKVNECVRGFEELGFPQCIGAIDGCHIEVHRPADDAVDHFNYINYIILNLTQAHTSLKFVNNSRKHNKATEKACSWKERSIMLIRLIKYVQQTNFSAEILLIQNGEPVANKSLLAALPSDKTSISIDCS